MNTTTTDFDPIRIPGSSALCWMMAHPDLIASYIDVDDYLLMILHSGHRIYGYTSEAGACDAQDIDNYPERHTPEYWAEDFADNPKWTAAIKAIPALYAYYEPY